MKESKLHTFKKKLYNRLAFIVALSAFALGYGSIGFKLITEASWFDSFYMTVVTMSTVGYHEVIDLRQFPGARLFASSTIFLGLATSGACLALMTDLLIEDTLLDVMRGNQMKKILKKMANHYIICGYGSTGKDIVRTLLAENERVVVIDSKPIEDVENLGVLFLQGDARKDEVLEEAGVERAAGLATTLREDADNLFVVLTARALHPGLKIVSRFKDDDTEKKLKTAGADYAVSPYRIGGVRLALHLAHPAMVDVVDATQPNSAMNVHFAHLTVPQNAAIRKLTLEEARIRERSQGALLVGVVDQNGVSRFNPNPECDLQDVRELIVLGDNDQIQALCDDLNT